ncbi:hypothetical protein ORIO_06780 [Cereibacter azotoformans]|uniref:TnsA endonuclease N-terminal domain-containing protein n=1 Tax=Cereibacter sphaeroides (strain ATCC 17025 / ATH 2.4.3) TaxID=349102 RepID=A4WSF7_CERS5|nr:hypothetical protein [Cereibacter azotoformans]ULB09624.1 hypothetical protein ORIO_06780 [Cereibacter azotoformans]
MSEEVFDHDSWNYSPPKLPKQSKLTLGPIHGVLPFDGVRNPGSRSATSHRVWFPYQTEANDWKPKVGVCESAAEHACALQFLINPDTYDLHCQPLTVLFKKEGGGEQPYTHDLLWTARNGHRRLVFVRHETSLSKPYTWRDIAAIIKATPSTAADDLIVVNANDYPRQRRENLFRMHQFVRDRDDEADEIVLSIARRLKTLWLMRDLFPHTPIAQHRVFRACYRLVARGLMRANLDHVLWEHSRVAVA